MRIIVLDAGPLGLASKRSGNPDRDRCRRWIGALDAAGARIVVPDVADYEVRRELTRANAAEGLARLDLLEAVLDYDPITTATLRKAAELWAHVRKLGLPTAGPASLDADAVLAAHALLVGGPGDLVTIATTNPRHLNRFPGIDAAIWNAIII